MLFGGFSDRNFMTGEWTRQDLQLFPFEYSTMGLKGIDIAGHNSEELCAGFE